LTVGLLDLLFVRQKNTANTAKERLRIIVAQERSARGGPDYLPMLRRELLEVITKYVNVDADAVKVDLVKDGEHDMLDISVSLPEKDDDNSLAARA
jgi:cell division topological specificity factor